MYRHSPMFSPETPKRAQRSLRARVAAAFRSISADRRTAQERTWDFFSSTGAEWARRGK